MNLNNNPDFLRLQWKENAVQWPLLVKAVCDLLSCSALEVDVKRLFSSCRDTFVIRRYALKVETVRVLTLLQSAYILEDNRDHKLIKSAMALNIVKQQNSIIQRLDTINSRLEEGRFSIRYFIGYANHLFYVDSIPEPPLKPPSPTNLVTSSIPSTSILIALIP